ncbi:MULTISPECIES: 16S rRNA (uracil(1498)-N(3))-methyltransferase [unclassified Psychrobacter]|uniref:16S rRNA (uracil(1498)-N(3))-methyltransferase n=1 Tax=unclassified Psychrobacter TaxID=196806 RepID=UPI000412D3CB|nr:MULTISPECIES: 16S rRNA (uracil(1498)-N(3))-methyltransferase [unclassified Psychrobacter]
MNCLLLPIDNFSNADATSAQAYISDPKQIDHIHKVLGLQVGDSLKIGQLGGKLGSAIIDDMTPTVIQLREVQLTLAPPNKLDLTVVLALPRPKVLRRLIMDMTALGVAHIILINSYRSQKSYWQSPMLGRLDEFVLEGLQQSVDTIAPTITLEKRFKPFVEDKLPRLLTDIDGQAIVAHPYGALSLSAYLQRASTDSLPKIVFIGSEGGWIDYEIELLATQGCQALTIGSRILRTEAAVNVIVGQWLLPH